MLSFDTSCIWLNMPFFVHAEIYPQTPSQFYHQGCFRTWHNCLVCKFNKLINKQKKGVKTLQKSFVKVPSDENNTIKPRVVKEAVAINKGNPPWIGMWDWTYRQFTIVFWGFVTFLSHNADEVWVIRTKYSFRFLNFYSEFWNSL